MVLECPFDQMALNSISGIKVENCSEKNQFTNFTICTKQPLTTPLRL